MNPVIVVLAYNRPKAVQRLLDSLAGAYYLSRPTLIISLEGGATPDVVSLARNFSAPSLDVHVVEHKRKLGLRNHVISCADLSLEFGSVIILEDDLVVDRYFYYYASHALRYYEGDGSICGVALYGYEYNQFSGFPFRPMRNGYSTYMMQVACSSGQCWTKAQWIQFKAWYAGKQPSDLETIVCLPAPVRQWPETSWKKYFHGYMVETNKYFIYPYSSFSTNCSDSGGTHVPSQSNLHQTCLATPQRPPPALQFCLSENREIVYDPYMEPVGDFVFRTLGLDPLDVAIDFHGKKPLDLLRRYKYVVTARKCNSFLAAYGYAFRPPEMNLMFPISSGNQLVWYFAPASAILRDGRTPASIARFAYFSGMRLTRNDLELLFIRAFFKRHIKKILRIGKSSKGSS